jgi:hypothetical protein
MTNGLWDRIRIATWSCRSRVAEGRAERGSVEMPLLKERKKRKRRKARRKKECGRKCVPKMSCAGSIPSPAAGSPEQQVGSK